MDDKIFGMRMCIQERFRFCWTMSKTFTPGKQHVAAIFLTIITEITIQCTQCTLESSSGLLVQFQRLVHLVVLEVYGQVMKRVESVGSGSSVAWIIRRDVVPGPSSPQPKC